MSVVSPLYEDGIIHSVRLSTRPDAIDDVILENLQKHHVSTIELGVQSMDDAVLRASNRGHTSDDVRAAVKMIRRYPFMLGLQIMPGLPSEDMYSLLRTANAVRELAPDFVRIYPTVVIDDTLLADAYKCEKYTPLTLQEAVTRTAFLKLFLKIQGLFPYILIIFFVLQGCLFEQQLQQEAKPLKLFRSKEIRPKTINIPFITLLRFVIISPSQKSIEDLNRYFL